MGRIAGEFARSYPEVWLEVTTEDRPVDMIEEGFDLAIWVNPAPEESFVGRILLRDRLVVVASPGLTWPAPSQPVPAVVRSAGDRQAWQVRTPVGLVTIAVEPVVALSSMIMVRDAVRAGAGAARLPVSLVKQDRPAALTQWGDLEGPEIALWALYPSRRLLSGRVSAFLDHLKAAFPQGTPDELASYVGR